MRCGTPGETQTSNTVSPVPIPITIEESTHLDYSAVAGTENLFSPECCARVLFFCLDTDNEKRHSYLHSKHIQNLLQFLWNINLKEFIKHTILTL